MMSRAEMTSDTVPPFDDALRAVVRLAAAVAVLGEQELRPYVAEAVQYAPGAWAEEVILQSYLFAGFPRALNAMREWRRQAGTPAPTQDPGEAVDSAADWRVHGEATCRAVYGRHYTQLRHNIRALHPALDAWMIVEGYGKVLSRETLDIRRRELCVIAACAAARQDRQLHSHLLGALNVGASASAIDQTLDAIGDFLATPDRERYAALWGRVRPEHRDVH